MHTDSGNTGTNTGTIGDRIHDRTSDTIDPVAASTAVECLKRFGIVSFLVTTLFTQTACGVFQPVIGLFSDDDAREPAELVDFEQELTLNRQWSVRVGKGQGNTYTQLNPVIDGPNIYVASVDGVVMAVDRDSGEVRWRRDTGEPITGGVGANSGLVLFGTREAEIFALDQQSGDTLWSTAVSTEVLSAPQTDGRIVVAQTIDDKLVGLDAGSGEQRWIYESTVPILTLRGSSTPVITAGTVIAGFGNGTLVAVNADNGFLRWEERVAVPQGRYDIEKVIDVDGDLLLSGGTVLASSYQGNVMAFDIETGRIVWGREASSYHGLAEGFGNIYYSDEESRIVAIRNNSDRLMWENDQLLYRAITAPSTISNYVAVGDFEGYVHLLSQVDGRFVARTRTDKDGIRASLVTDRGMLYAYGNSGTLTALSIR